MTEIARAAAAISATRRGLGPTGLSIDMLRTLSAAYGVSWRARAERRRYETSWFAIRPWGVNPFGSSVPPRWLRGNLALLARQYNQTVRRRRHPRVHIRTRAGLAPGPRLRPDSGADYWM